MKIELIEDWRKAWRLWSVQVFALVAVLPDIYNGIAALGWLEELPDPAKWSIRAMGAIGIVVRVIRRSERADVAP